MNEPFELVRLRGGAFGVRSARFGEVCHPGVGPRAEAEAVYVRGLELDRRFAEPESGGEFVVWDIGLGGGANATAVFEAASRHPIRLTMLSFDLDLGPLDFAVRHAAELDYFGPHEAAARGLLASPRTEWACGRATVRWSRHLGDFPALLAGAEGDAWPPPHAILFDPFSPTTNPAMWSLPLFESLFRRLSPHRPCLLATYSRGTAVRVAMLLAGFHVGIGEGTDTKEETTRAANRADLLTRPLDHRWLERARRSTAAEPWTSAERIELPLSTESWARLRAHPQFAER